VLAGGTDLLPLMKFGLAAPATLISLKHIRNCGDRARDQEVFIGAMTLLADLAASPLIRERFAALHQAVESVAAPPS